MVNLLFSGVYFGFHFAFGLFTPFNSWTARQDIKSRKIQIIVIGEMPLNFNQKQKLANSYGFDFYVLGCNATKEILNGTEYYNQEMVDYLESKFGTGWWTKIQTQLDSIDHEMAELQKPIQPPKTVELNTNNLQLSQRASTRAPNGNKY